MIPECFWKPRRRRPFIYLPMSTAMPKFRPLGVILLESHCWGIALDDQGCGRGPLSQRHGNVPIRDEPFIAGRCDCGEEGVRRR